MAILARLLRLAHKAAVFALLSASAISVTACGGGSTPAQPRHAELATIFEDPAQLLSAPAQTLAQLRALGVEYVRISVGWSALAPAPLSSTRPNGFDAASPSAYPSAGWGPYDAVVRLAATRGIHVLLNPTGPAPQWATSPGAVQPGPLGVWKPSAREFGQFVHAVGERYSGDYTPPGAAAPLPRVSFWSIWNEPNYGSDLAPQAIDHSAVEVAPRLYRGLLDSAWAALGASGHTPARDTILIGELAPRGITVGDNPGNYSGMVPLRFLRALYCLDNGFHELRAAAAAARGCPTDAAGSAGFAAAHPALFSASGFAAHPYPQGTPPNFHTPDEPDYADLASLPKLEQTLDRAHAIYGSSNRFPIYSTEFGYITDPPTHVARGVSPTLAAYYMNWAEYMSWRDPRVRSYDQYLLIDPAPTASHFASGLEFVNGRPKPAFDAFRMPIFLPVTATKRGQALEVWGCVRPARFAKLRTGATQVAQIQLQPPGGTGFRTIRRVALTDPYGYFEVPISFPSSGSVRLAWGYPNGRMVYSRTVTVTVS
jgi:hypothetical protein